MYMYIAIYVNMSMVPFIQMARAPQREHHHGHANLRCSLHRLAEKRAAEQDMPSQPASCATGRVR